MKDRAGSSESDPLYHSHNIKEMLVQAARHSRDDVDKVTDAKAKALFETTAEVLLGLANAYDHFEQKSEKAWT